MSVAEISAEEQRARYEEWIAWARPLLEAHNFKEAFAKYPFIVNRETPWTPLKKDLSECTVVLITSGGVYVEGDEPFDKDNVEGDWSYREIKRSTPKENLRIAHSHFDNTYALKDINTIFPVDRLSELEANGTIDRLADVNFSLMGYCPRAHDLMEETIPKLVGRIEGIGADVAFITPV